MSDGAGLPMLSPVRPSGWENEYQELKSLLTDVEYKAAMNSTITAYYTEPRPDPAHLPAPWNGLASRAAPTEKILDPVVWEPATSILCCRSSFKGASCLA